MSTNMKLGNPDTILYRNGGSAQTSGQMVVKGSLVAILKGDVAANESVAAWIKGAFSYAKETGQAWTQGVKLYYDSGNDRLTTTSTSNTLVGVADDDYGSSAAIGGVILDAGLQA